jgi:hypothetical protein
VLFFQKDFFMANRLFQQFAFSLVKYPVTIECNALIGASGATSSLKGSGVTSLTRVAAGTYKLVLEDDYYRFFNLNVFFRAPTTGAAITAGSFVSGTLYQIVTVGTTDYSLVGLDTGVTAAPGVPFVATGVGAGTGTVLAIGHAGIYAYNVSGDPQLTVSRSGAIHGSVIYFKTLNSAGAATDPTSGSQMFVQVLLRNSSVKGKGE